MKAFWLVICDLYDFVIIEMQSFFGVAKPALATIAPRKQPSLLPIPTPVQLLPKEASHTQALMVIYVTSVSANLYAFPAKTFDGVITTVSYGQALQFKGASGRWLEVLFQNTTGWILKDETTSQQQEVLPELEIGHSYVANDEVTKKIRMCINDTFAVGDLGLDLQDTEHVTYHLAKLGKHIQWSHERPRIAGRWHSLLKQALGVHMAILPRAGSIMEYVKEVDGTGHVCFVQAVLPDESLQIQGVGLYEEGVYYEALLSHEVWRELRPVFIEVY